MSIVCTFYLAKTSERYESGEAVRGFINLNVSDPIAIEDIQIELCGQGLVSWRDRKSRGAVHADVEGVEYKSKECYVQYKYVLMGRRHLEATTYILPFSLTIPRGCPTSFESSLGLIRYYLSVTVFPQRGIKENFKRNIKVVLPDDLNEHPEYRVPVQIETVKKLFWLVCSAGSISITMTTPFAAYAPLQRLHYTVCMQNLSMNDVTGYIITIVQKVTYTARIPETKKCHTVKEILNEQFDNKCVRLTSVILEHFIDIPRIPPSTDCENDESIIKIKYELKIKVLISGCAFPAFMSMPLHIGTVPIDESLLPPVSDEADIVNPTVPILTQASSGNDSPPSYQNMEPPSFFEATRNNQPPSFDSVMTSTAPPYESTEDEIFIVHFNE